MAVGLEYLSTFGALPTGARTATAFQEGQKTASDIANDQLRQQTLSQAMRFNEMQQPYVMAGLRRTAAAEDIALRQAQETEAARGDYLKTLQPGGLTLGAAAQGTGYLPTIATPAAAAPAGLTPGLGAYTTVPTKPVGYTDTGAPLSLVQSESGGKSNLVNQWGYGGRLQFGQARLNDAIAAGVIPAGTTVQQFAQNPQMQQAVETWHFNDLNNYIRRQGLDKYVGQTVGGNVVTPQGMISGAHLGGSAGLKKHLETGGKYNPADPLGTRLSDYMAKHSGPAAAPGTSGFSRDISALGGQLTSGGLGEAAGGFYATPTGRLAQAAGQAAGYFTSTPERQAEIARYEDMRRAAKDWFYSPQTVNALTSRPELMQEAQRDPLAFYQKYSASTAAPTAPTQLAPPAVMEPAPMGATQTFSKEVQAALSAPPGAEVPMPDAKAYANNPPKMSRDMQIIQFQDKQLTALQQYLAHSGNVAGAAEAGLKRAQLFTTFNNLQGLQAISMFDLGDYATASRLMSSNMGRSIGFQPLDNGNFNLVVDGQTVRQNASKAEVKDMLSYQLSDTYKQQTIKMAEQQLALKDFQMKEAIKSGNARAEETLKQELIGLRDIMLERAKSEGWEFTKGGEGQPDVYRSKDGRNFYYMYPDGKMDINGVEVIAPMAKRVPVGIQVPQQ